MYIKKIDEKTDLLRPGAEIVAFSQFRANAALHIVKYFTSILFQAGGPNFVHIREFVPEKVFSDIFMT